MIRIVRPEKPPELLSERAPALVRDMVARYVVDPQAYRDGAMAFEFEQGLYGHPTVKQQLETAQWNKCCYCEIRIVSEHGDVEHFRPKAGVRQAEGERLHRPGYFWLVYAWSNLLYACSKCNRTYKRDLFPLEDLASRADALRDDGSTAKEAPLLVDPSGEIFSAAEARAVFSAMIRCALRRWLAPAPGFPCSEEQLVAWALAGAGSASK